MIFSVKKSGTASEVANHLAEQSAEIEKGAGTPSESNQVDACFHGLVEILGTVADDRQATITVAGDVRGDQVLQLYIDLAVLPSAAAVKVAAPPAPAKPETGHREEID